MSTTPRLPLEGVRVLDLTEVWAGPMGAMHLADLGADVIKVESFPRAPMTRPVGPIPGRRGFAGGQVHPTRPWESSATHNMANRNKRGATLNLASPRGMTLLEELVRVSDVLMESYSAGTSQKMGIDYPALKQIRPDVIVASMPGWGVEGPYKGYVTLGSGLDAYTGHYGLRGYPDTDPTLTPPVFHTDAIGALTVAFAVLTALHYRTRTGKGQWIDLSQAEAFIPHLAGPVMDYAMNRRLPSPIGNRDHAMAPHGCYRCQGEDAWAVVAVASDEEWRSLCVAVGHPEWADDQRFADAASRHKHQDELDLLIQNWTLQHEKEEVMRILQEAGVAAGAVLDDADLYQDRHLKARGFFLPVTHPVVGEHLYPGFLWRFDKTPGVVRLPPNLLGGHNKHIYGELLGLGPGAIEGLETEGIIGDSYSPDAAIDPQDRVPQT